MPKSKELTFEDQLKRLEQIVTQLETKDVPLEDSLKLFEEGVRLARTCQKTLEGARQKVEILVKETGQLEPFTEGDN